MKHKVFLTAILMVAMVITTNAVAQNYDFSAVCSTGQTLYYRITNSSTHTVAVTHPASGTDFDAWDGYNMPTDSLAIPDTVSYNSISYTVDTVDEYAFSWCSGLTSVTIGGSVTSIGDWAFYSCIGLTSVTIGGSVTSIGNYAFYYCSGLTSVTIPNSVTSIGNTAFKNCSGLTSIVVTSGNTYYDSRNNCNAIIETATNTLIAGCQNTIIPNSVTSIGSSAFYYCSGLTSVTIPNSATSIGNSAFYYCSGLTSVTIPNSVTSIGNYAFEGCSGLTSVTIGSSVTSIGDWAFWNCSGLTSVTIPNSVTSIGDKAFAYCNGLTYIVVESGNTHYDSRNSCNAIIETATNTLIQGCRNTIIPNSVTSIGNYAFYYCSGLTSVTIPNSVTSIGLETFKGCSEFTSITSLATVPPTLESNTFQNVPDTIPVYVPCSSVAAYRAADGWNSFNNIQGMPIGTDTTIAVAGGQELRYHLDCDRGYAHVVGHGRNCSGDLVIPSTITINGSSYYVVTIGDSAFCNCTGLTSLTLSNNLFQIGFAAFSGCTALGSLNLGRVQQIAPFAFMDCDSLTAVTLPQTFVMTGVGLFAGCDNLASIVVESGNPAFDSRYNCNAVINSNTNILLYGCKNSILPPTSTGVWMYAFYDIPITDVVMPSSANYIDQYAFFHCDSLRSFTIGDSVATIGNAAFAYCSNLSSLRSNAIVPPTLGSDVFWNVPNTIPVYVPCGSKSAYSADTGWNYFSNIQGIYDSHSIETDTACNNYTWHGRTFTASTDTATYRTTNAAGCDSTVTLNLTIISCDTSAQSQNAGALSGEFSVASGRTVHFSQGNLQYQASTGTWRFATNQWDVVGSQSAQYSDQYGNFTGSDNSNISSSYSGWIDLFGWGTSGWNNGNTYYRPYDTDNSDYTLYGPYGSYNLTGAYANSDWGVYNAISNGGNAAGMWRTLTDAEWNYLLNTRANASSKAGYATVAGVNGVILLPDSFTDPMKNNGSGAFVPRATTGWSANVYSAGDWDAMQTAGAVFLPAAGSRNGTTVYFVGSSGYYWSSTYSREDFAYSVYFLSGDLNARSADARQRGFSVRLVRGYSCNSASVDTINACDRYTWHGRTFTASTDTATYTTTNAAGCDSTVTLNLTLNYSSSASETDTACNSYLWNNHGNSGTFTLSGTYFSSYYTPEGCLSVDTLNLTVNYSTSGAETVTACNSYTWHGRAFSASTDTATYRTTNAAGCDSTATLHLTINQCSTTETTACDSYTWHGTAYTTSGTYTSGTDTLVLTINHSTTGTETVTACNSYTWHGRAFSASTDTATYRTTNAAGCDSTATLHLTINQCSTTETTACDSYTWHGTAYTTSGTYTSGTDTLVLTINHSTTGTETVTACNSYTWHGRAFSASTDTATYHTTNAAGCDSTATLHLTVYHDSSTSYTVSEVGSYTWTNHGTSNTYTQSGIYTNSYTTTEGCAGIDTLHLTITTSPHTQYYTVSALSANASMGRASVEGDSQVEEGHTATVRATANNGYYFVRWSNGATANPYTFTVTQDTVLTATFATRSYTVTVVNGNPGRGIVNGSGTAQHGARHNVSAAPNYGYRFSHWSDGDNNASRTITVTGDITLTAYFDMAQFHVAAQPANYAQGAVSGGGDYDYQAFATLTATPANGYEFDHWSDGDTINPRRITVTRDTVLTAVFRMVPVIPTHTVTVVSANPAMGSVIGGGTYDEGAVAAIAAIANSGCEFTGWTDGSTANPRMITVTGDTTFTARFRQIPTTPTYTITVTSNDAAMGRVSGSGTYDEGATAHIGAYPSAHCRFVRWSDGNTNAQRTITVNGNLSLTAFFARDSVNITVRANDDRMGRVTGGGSYAYGSEATLTATPLSGYRFVRWSTGERTSSITVTVRNATSYTAFFESTTQGVDEADGESIRVWSHGLTIHVAGLTGEPLKVYDVTGRLVAERTAAHGDMVIPVTHPGLYLVQTGTVTHKVLTR